MSIAKVDELSISERDRRWKAIRDMMKERNLDCLIIADGVGEQFLNYTQYVSNDVYQFARGAVIFPIDEEPTSFGGWARLGAETWISDRRPRAALGSALVSGIKELGYSEGKIGVVGLEGMSVFGANPFTDEGWIPYKTWSYVEKSLPKARFEDITPQMAEIGLVKSPEELSLVEKAAGIGERMHEHVLSITKPGVTDREVRSKIAESIIREGAMFDVASLEMRPGVVRNGDVINSEYGIKVGDGGYAQVTMCIAVGDVSEETEKLAGVAHACMETGLEGLKPGAKFGDVIDPMEKVVAESGFWHGFPLLHSLNPQVIGGPTRHGPPPIDPSPMRGSETVVKSGMTFSYEAGARTGPVNQVKVGGTCVVTDTGVHMLNILGTKLQRI